MSPICIAVCVLSCEDLTYVVESSFGLSVSGECVRIELLGRHNYSLIFLCLFYFICILKLESSTLVRLQQRTTKLNITPNPYSHNTQISYNSHLSFSCFLSFHFLTLAAVHIYSNRNALFYQRPRSAAQSRFSRASIHSSD